MASNCGRKAARTMYRSVDRLQDKENKRKSTVPESPSPYSAQYRSNVTHDQRVLIGQRNHVTKLHRHDLEDRYLSLLDEHFALKKENLANHDNIRKLITKLMRLSAAGGDCGGTTMGSRLNSASSKQNLSNDEDLHLRMLDLESYNAQLRERLNSMIRCSNTNRSRCSSAVATFRGSSSALSKSSENKVYQSQDHIPRIIQYEPFLRRQSRPLSDLNKPSSKLSKANVTLEEQSHERDREHEPTSDDPIALELQVQEEEIAELKAIIERLKLELSTKSPEPSNQPSSSLQAEVDEITQRLSRREDELMSREKKLQTEVQKLRKTHQDELGEKTIKIDELTTILNREIVRNKTLSLEKQQLEMELTTAIQNSQVTEDVLAENRLLKTHRDNISSLANELAARTERLETQRRENVSIRSQLDDANTELATFRLWQADIVQKIQGLQDANDELSVANEGLRAQCECLREANSRLIAENNRLVNEVA